MRAKIGSILGKISPSEVPITFDEETEEMARAISNVADEIRMGQ